MLDLSLAFAGAFLHFGLDRLMPLRCEHNEKVVLVACARMRARAFVRPCPCFDAQMNLLSEQT